MNRIEEIETRLSAIKQELEGEGADINALNSEVDTLIEERKALLDAIETRKATLAKVANLPTGTPVITKEDRNMDLKELRNSQEYINKYAEYVKTGEDAEVRAALLTTNVEGGTIAVPDFVLDIIKTAWDKNEIMSLVSKSNIKGNLKVNFEISGDPAVVHVEGSGAVTEENLTEGIVTLVPEYIKKWKSFSDEVMSMRGEAFLRYIYAELTHKIVKKMADLLIGKIAALPTVATATSPSAAVVKVAPGMGTVAQAIANLSDEAGNPVIVMNKLTWAEFKRVQYANGYAVDPFEGLAVKFNDTLPAYSAASEDDVYMIVGDFGEGALANFPNGDSIEFTLDTLTRKKEDLVEVLGKEYVGLGVITSRAFTKVTKPANA